MSFCILVVVRKPAQPYSELMTFTQFQWTWQGWSGAPGVSLFRVQGDCDSTQADAAAAAQRALLVGVGITNYPSNVSLTCEPLIKVIADGDGSLVDQRTLATVPSAITGSGSGNWSAVTGACIVWRTAQSTGRRMLMGRTFLVPLATAAFNTQGQLASAFLTGANTALSTYITRVAGGVPGHPLVWHRPVNKAGGFGAAVTGATINKAGAEIRRRRD